MIFLNMMHSLFIKISILIFCQNRFINPLLLELELLNSSVLVTLNLGNIILHFESKEQSTFWNKKVNSPIKTVPK